MNPPTNVIQTALLLRIVAILAFPVGVVIAALMERSVLMVALLAAGMLAVSGFDCTVCPGMRGTPPSRDYCPALLCEQAFWLACSLSALACSLCFVRPFWRGGSV